MTRNAALHQLLTRLFAADELRRLIVHGRDGDELGLLLPGVEVSPARLADSAVEALERRGLIDHEFFDEIERARPRRTEDVRVVRSMWLSGAKDDGAEPPETEAGVSASSSPRPAEDPSTADEVVESRDYHGEIDPSAEYYALTLTVDKNGRAVRETQTHWVGYADGKPGVELRAPSRVHPERMIADWKDIGQAPVAVVKNGSQFTWYFLHMGGNAIVHKAVLEKWLPSLFQVQRSVQAGFGAGFSSSAADVAASRQPTPPPVQRMAVLRRDRYHCRICGRTDEAAGADLDVRHIHSFDQGGPTLPWNLITLCKLCRAGVTAADHDHLRQKADDWRARLAGQTSEYWDGVRRWRTFVKAKFADDKRQQ